MNNRIFFASANTTLGFRNYFRSIFDPERFHQIYILKGGPGTGKSSLIKRIAMEAENRGLTVDRFLCSSDPNSLDGALIWEIGVAILDGTAPHAIEPNYPGIVENIVNTGAFWNKKLLLENKRFILFNIQEKSRYYRRAYQFLKAMGEIEKEIKMIGESALQNDKMEASIERTMQKICSKNKKPSEEIRLIHSYNFKGNNYLNSYASLSDSVYILEDNVFSAYLYLEQVLKKARENGQSIWIGYSNRFPDEIEAIFFPERKCSFIIGERNYANEEKNKEYHYVNMNRFLDKELIRQNRQKIRFGKKCSDMLLNGAKDAFQQAFLCHEKLEKIYVSAMDFVSLQKMTDQFVLDLFENSRDS